MVYKHAYCTHCILSLGWFFLLFGIRGSQTDVSSCAELGHN